MSNIYKGSFIAPVKRQFPDGRRQLSTAIRKMHRGAPLSATMQKSAAMAERPSAFGAPADETLHEIKKVHRTGRRAGLPQHTAEGDGEFDSKSVNMVKRARAHALPVTANRLLSANELNKAFSEQAGKLDVDLDELELPLRNNDHGRSKLRNGYATGFRPMAAQELRKLDLRKLTTAKPRANDRGVTDDYNRGAPESANGQWTDVHANTGATNDWHDQITPTTKPTRITFPQFGVPGRSTRDAAVDAIKTAWAAGPQRMGASPNVDDSFTRER
jgi:hypothetical protein